VPSGHRCTRPGVLHGQAAHKLSVDEKNMMQCACTLAMPSAQWGRETSGVPPPAQLRADSPDLLNAEQLPGK